MTWSDRKQVVEAPPKSTQMATCTPVIPDVTITITYTAIGQIVGGKLKVTVPDGDDWADATAASIDVSSGSAKYGGDLSD